MAFWGGRKDEEVQVEDIRVRAAEAPREVHSDKVVIVTGPTVGAALGFMALGALLGAVATTLIKSGRSQNATELADPPDASDAQDSMESVAERANRVAERARNLAGRAREAVHSASEIIGPVIQDALGEARSAARQTEEELAAELADSAGHSAPEKPDVEEAKRDVVATGTVAVGVSPDETVEVRVPPNAEVEVPAGTQPVEVTETAARKL